MARDRVERLAAGFRVRGERAIEAQYVGQLTVGHPPQPAAVQVRRAGQERLELTPDEADAFADALKAEAAFARGDAA